jgi:predicted aldo/keto reductase-like oxidoreductase
MHSSRRNFLAAGLTLPAARLSSADPAGAGLRYRVLGKTGLKVTSVGFGCMITSDASVIEKAADVGINYFDTARGYQGGNNERMVGAALKSRRKQLYISSKTGAHTKEEALSHLETSLRELGTDYLDIWYLHGKTRAGQLTDELIDAQRVARKEGKIRFAGFSTHGGFDSVIPAAVRLGQFDVILTSYNFTMGKDMDALIDQAKAAGIGIIAMKVMAGGFRRARPGDRTYDTLKRDGAMVAALKWVLRNPKVDSTIPSMTDLDQLDDNFKAMTAPFGDADEKVLAAQLDHIRPMYCRMCGRCDGVCPRGVPVADVLRFLAYAEGYGQFSLGRERFLDLPAEVRDVRCGDCDDCAVRCPNGVQVAGRLIRAQELFA